MDLESRFSPGSDSIHYYQIRVEVVAPAQTTLLDVQLHQGGKFCDVCTEYCFFAEAAGHTLVHAITLNVEAQCTRMDNFHVMLEECETERWMANGPEHKERLIRAQEAPDWPSFNVTNAGHWLPD